MKNTDEPQSRASAPEPTPRAVFAKIKRIALDVEPKNVPIALAQIVRLCIDAGAASPGDRNWTEDAAHENGNYECLCCECDQPFIGHKRRVVCKACSTRPAAQTLSEQFERIIKALNYDGNDTNSLTVGEIQRAL
jgi:hypothetical protein